MRLLDELAERKLWEMWGARERMHLYIYIYIYIGPRSGDNEATPSIQQMTRGEIGTTKRRHPFSEWHVAMLLENAIEATVSVKRCTPIRSWRVAFPLEDEMSTKGQPMILRHVAHRDPCKWALNYVNILDDPLNEGATNRIVRNLFISNSSIRIVHVQKSRRDQEPPKETKKCSWTRIWFIIDEVSHGR